MTLSNSNNLLFTAGELAQMLQAELVGVADKEIKGLAKIEEAGPTDLSFVANPKYERFVGDTLCGSLLVNKGFNTASNSNITYLVVDDAYDAFTTVLNELMGGAKKKTGISASAFVAENAKVGTEVYVGHQSVIDEHAIIGDDCIIHSQVFVGNNVKLGKGCVLHPGVKIYEDCQIGDNTVIHSGAVIGCDGFGFAPQPDGSLKKVAQLGNVIIGDKVEIGSNTTIDRATLGSTIIKDGVKIDNQVQIAHNVVIGAHTVIAAQTGIAGSTKIGKHCVIGGQVGFVGHIEVADGSQIGAKTGVNRSIKEPFKKWDGLNAMPLQESLRAKAMYKKLPLMEKRLYSLEKYLEELKANS